MHEKIKNCPIWFDFEFFFFFSRTPKFTNTIHPYKTCPALISCIAIRVEDSPITYKNFIQNKKRQNYFTFHFLFFFTITSKLTSESLTCGPFYYRRLTPWVWIESGWTKIEPPPPPPSHSIIIIITTANMMCSIQYSEFTIG